VVTCSSCGSSNPAGVKFCTECGARLAQTCASCGVVLLAGAKFCGECGAPVADAAGRAAGAAPGALPAPAPDRATPAVAERRVVSVLFADLVGFTALSADLDPEETRELLSRYFDLAREVIERYGGSVEKFIGDAVMAVWGAPTAHEDDAERAVRAGLELVDAVRTLGPGLQARAGVLTGEAAVTIGATNQGMVAGDLVNTASRLQSVAAAGTVLVGEATQRAASRAIAFETVGEQTLRGKPTPVPAWRALRVVAERGGRNRSDTLEAPFVGRDDELRLLKDLFHSTSREGRPRLVSVIGPAGIGKTRLAWEFLKYVDGLVERVWWHDGRCPAYGDGISFWALGEMVRARAGLVETDDEATTRARIAATLAEHVPDEAERHWIEPALLALLGFGEGLGSDQLFGAWRTFFERLAATAPVLMVFEDAHYADAGLLDFIDHLMDWCKSAPVYVVTLARPELLEKRPTFGAGKRNFTSLYLEPLSGPAMHELLAGLIPGLPETAARAIVDRADGVPLYAVETVRMLVAEGRIEQRGDAYVPVGDLSSVAVPETLTALITSRLDGLAPADRALVSDAAVLGQSFTLAGLSAVSAMAEAELEPRLAALVRRELFSLEADPRSPERGQYAFVQALIREVAYHTLAKADRKSRHLAAARFFEAIGSDELAGALAVHYLAAHANATPGPEADALAGQARIALRAAAQRAAGLGSHDQAVAFLDQALQVTTEPAERAEIFERAGEAAELAGRHASSEEHLGAAVDAWRELGDRRATARAIAARGQALLTARRTSEAVAILEPAPAEFADLAGEASLARVHSQLARAYWFAGQPRRALEVVEGALEVCEREGLTALLADALVTKGSLLSDLGRIQEGVGVIETGERLARSAGLTTTLLRGLNNRTVSLGEFDPDATLAAQQEGLALARRMGLRYWVFGFAVGCGYTCFQAGLWDQATTYLADSLADDPSPADRISLLSNAVLVPAYRGEDVAEELAEIERLVGAADDLSLQSQLYDARGNHALASGQLTEAFETLRQTAAANPSVYGTEALCLAARAALWMRDANGAAAQLAAMDAMGFRTPSVEARRATLRAGLAALDGRDDEALALYRDALRRWRDLRLATSEAMCGIDMATLLGPSDGEVAAVAASTRQILERLGATPLIARLDAATRGASAPDAPGEAAGRGATAQSSSIAAS
jgi:class 3 adenylate cyclase/tetratricopeptide (TPR) repeat protein